MGVEQKTQGERREYLGWDERESEFRQDHEFLAGLVPRDWYELYLDPDRCFGLIAGAMLEEEYARYNGGAEPLPETKILFLIAPNLRDAKNLDGSRAREKEARWAKASEHDELVAVLSQFIDHYPGTPAERVYSEVADTFWNLIHLTMTDPKYRSVYEGMVDQMAEVLRMSKGQVGLLVIAKYQARLYEMGGRNHHGIEDAQVARLMVGHWARGDDEAKLPELDENKASMLFDVAQKVVRPKLEAQLKQLEADDEHKKIMEATAQAVMGVGEGE